MKWLVAECADLIAWRLTDDVLTLEVLTSGDALPSTGDVLQLAFDAPRSVQSIEEELGYVVKEGLWGISADSGPDGVVIRVEGEGSVLALKCSGIREGHLDPERRHYEHVFDRVERALQFTSKQYRATDGRLRRLRAFLTEQANRAERILAAGHISPAARSRAEGRLAVVTEAMHALAAVADESEDL